ncbi:MAG: prepilin-type N-terminal cleavage/methylation domain-containing protein [Minisyncoccia bacterium]
MKGFTLVETMVAVSIMAIAVAGPMYSADRAIVAAQNAANQLTALYLSQEGIEYVRAMRDSEYLHAYQVDSGAPVSTADAWLYFLSSSKASPSYPGNIYMCTGGAGGAGYACSLDMSQPVGTGVSGSNYALAQCSSGLSSSCPVLYVNGSGIYNVKSSGTATPFTRSVQATPVSGAEELITATTTWSFHGFQYQVVMADNLTEWQ